MTYSCSLGHEQLSKKEKRKRDKAWGNLNPVTRKRENSKAYNRKKAQSWKKEFPTLGLFL